MKIKNEVKTRELFQKALKTMYVQGLKSIVSVQQGKPKFIWMVQTKVPRKMRSFKENSSVSGER